jgi:hypothetical protein
MSLLEKLREESLAVNCPDDPWLAPLQRVRGKVEFDGLERVSSQTLLDMLEVPQRSRTAGTYRRLAKQGADTTKPINVHSFSPSWRGLIKTRKNCFKS